MRIEPIESDVLLARGETYDSSALLLVAGERVLLVEALGGRSDAEQLRRYIAEELRKSVRYVVATHYFSDHMAGLALFPEADVVAHRYIDTRSTASGFAARKSAASSSSPRWWSTAACNCASGASTSTCSGTRGTR